MLGAEDLPSRSAMASLLTRHFSRFYPAASIRFRILTRL